MSRPPSPLDLARNAYRPRLPAVLREDIAGIVVEQDDRAEPTAGAREIEAGFPRTYGRPQLRLNRGRGATDREPLKVGVVLSGGQAPGGHNVITGLFDGLRSVHPDSRLLGFLGGPRGILTRRFRELDDETLAPFRNTGGFDLIGSGRDKIEAADDLAASRVTCEELQLDGLLIVGGDDSNTNAAVLAESFLEHGLRTAVLGVPKTIDGDLKGGAVEASFGFDTATKVYSELIGNICRDARSAKKYWHIIKLMGRSASHVTLECALETQPNVALIGEEVVSRELTLRQVVEQVADAVRQRAAAGRNYGVCLLPEGLIEFIPEIRGLIAELNRLLFREARRFESIDSAADKQRFVEGELSADGVATLRDLPAGIRHQLLLDRDAHGNVQVSKIDTEQLLIEKVSKRIAEWRAEGRFSGEFRAQGHFFGYEGRCAAPTNFDADYTYTLGRLSAVLVASGKTGYLSSVRNLAAPPDEWRPVGVPLTSMMRMETRKGRPTPVIGKALVRLDAEPFRTFAKSRERWKLGDEYRYPGAIQYFGPPAVASRLSRTLELETAR